MSATWPERWTPRAGATTTHTGSSSPYSHRVNESACWSSPGTDNPGAPVKFRVFAHHLPIAVQTAGLYTIGLYESLQSTHAEQSFPLPVRDVTGAVVADLDCSP
jgi:hypothetical protein